MATSKIKFGTDGWRAGIAEEYTFDNVRLVAAALAAHLKKTEPVKARAGVAIGYDTRFLSAEFAAAVADAIAAAGVPVLLSRRDCPTPAIAWATRSRGLAAGVMITASHNPPRYNGFKFMTPAGGPADKAASGAVESLIGKKGRAGTTAPVTPFDPAPEFVAQLHEVIDFGLLKRARGSRAVCDFVHGTGRGYLDALLRECGWRVHTMRAEPDPMFGGILPDPANPACHAALQDEVRTRKAVLGLANDPDADRFGVVDETGQYLTPNQVLCLIYEHLLTTRGMSGGVARTVATTGLLDAIAAKHGQKVVETPVGFKWLGAALESGAAILCGEESGGLSIAGHVPGKDGVLADLLIAEVWAANRQPLSQLYSKLLRKYGAYYSDRIDLHMEAAAKDALMQRMEAQTPSQIAGVAVTGVNKEDGVKVVLQDDSWLLMRASGTEPIIRLYVEARTKGRLKELEQAAREL